MRKLFLVCAMAVFGLGQSFAQLDPDEMGFFNHVSLGVSAGTDGIGISLAAPMGQHFGLRAGYNFLPKFSYDTTLDLGSSSAFTTNEVKLKGELNMGDFHVLVDYYPFTSSSFHLTAGAYFGKDKFVSVGNTAPFVKESYWGNAGIELGTTETIYSTYTMVSDPNTGDVNADLKVNSFKPYVGIGFGRAVPRKRIGLQFDLGVQFWGTPELWTNIQSFDYNQGEYVMKNQKVNKNRITNPDSDYKDLKDAIKTIEKIGVYPVMTLRINGRIF